MSKKTFYITSTLPYVNADPHIGFALEMVQADAIARAKSLQGFEVFFNTGSDEHGLKILRNAEKAGMDPKAYCDQFVARFAELKQALNLRYNNFIRTTDEQHIRAAQAFWEFCRKNGDIYKKAYQVKYCVGCELEKTESELDHGKCPLHPNLEIELIDEENYFFRYSNYQQPLLEFYGQHPDFVVPQSRLKEMVEFTKRGLEDFSISRLKEKMPWGVEVPGDPDHVMYVWFDALVNYIAALGWPNDQQKFEAFWPGMQVAGKDNLRQQSSMWQAMLLSAHLPNSRQVFIHGFITSNGQKMSKSLGNVVNPLDVVAKYGTDALRYYLLREITPTEDGDFTYEKFEQRYHSDLAGGLGNLVARMFGIAGKLDWKAESSGKVDAIITDTRKTVVGCLESYRFNDALGAIWGLISACDKKINEAELWKSKDLQVINDIFFVISQIGELLQPLLPDTAAKIQQAIEQRQPVILFPKILDSK